MTMDRNVYPSGTLVVYAGTGVCRVTSVDVPPGQSKPFYTLSPLYGTEVIFVPVDTHAYLRPVFTRPEAEDFIRRIPSLPELALSGGNLQLLSRQYQACLQSHEPADLARLIKTTCHKDAAAREQGKRPGKLEETYRRRAEELLYGELAVSLGISRDKVPQQIRRMLKTASQEAAS